MLHLMFSPQNRYTLPSTIGRTSAVNCIMTKVSTGNGFLSTFCDKGKKMWCMWWNNWCLPQIKSVPINRNWRWHGDLGEVCVWMYDRPSTAEGVDDARLEMFVRSWYQAGIIRSHAVSSIPFRHSELCRLGMDEEDNIWQIFWTYYCGKIPAAEQM